MSDKVKLNLAITSEQKLEIKLEALKRGVNVNDMVIQALEHYIGRSLQSASIDGDNK